MKTKIFEFIFLIFWSLELSETNINKASHVTKYTGCLIMTEYFHYPITQASKYFINFDWYQNTDNYGTFIDVFPLYKICS